MVDEGRRIVVVLESRRDVASPRPRGRAIFDASVAWNDAFYFWKSMGLRVIIVNCRSRPLACRRDASFRANQRSRIRFAARGIVNGRSIETTWQMSSTVKRSLDCNKDLWIARERRTEERNVKCILIPIRFSLEMLEPWHKHTVFAPECLIYVADKPFRLWCNLWVNKAVRMIERANKTG